MDNRDPYVDLDLVSYTFDEKFYLFVFRIIIFCYVVVRTLLETHSLSYQCFRNCLSPPFGRYKYILNVMIERRLVKINSTVMIVFKILFELF